MLQTNKREGFERCQEKDHYNANEFGGNIQRVREREAKKWKMAGRSAFGDST